MSATKGTLSKLHELFTNALIKELEEANISNEPLPAADKSVIAKFLKDNDIYATPDSTQMDELRDHFIDEVSAKRKEKQAQILNAIKESGDDFRQIIEG